MSSIQQSLPFATNKVINSILDVRKSLLNELDYHVEPITVHYGPDYIQVYSVYINYINGIQIIGDLYEYNDYQYKRVEGEMVSGVYLQHGKLTCHNHPYHVGISVGSDLEYMTLKCVSAPDLYVKLNQYSWDVDTEDMLDRYTYDYVYNKVTKTKSQESMTKNIYSNAFIQCPFTNENNVVNNDVYYIESIPNNRTDAQPCYLYTP